VSDYPEHEKLKAISDRSQEIGEFLDYGLPRMGVVLAEWDDGDLYPTHRSIEGLLAEYFDIDKAKIDDEKDAMLAAIREANSVT
jgi:hypothetical protein